MGERSINDFSYLGWVKRLRLGLDGLDVVEDLAFVLAEAVVVAYLINDVKLKKLLQDSFGKSDEECVENGWDVHKITAASMFGCSVFDVTKEQRTVGKTIRHACVDKDTSQLIFK